MPTLIVRCHNVDWSSMVFANEGYMGIYNRIIEPAKPRPGDRVAWWYPFTPNGHNNYKFCQNRYEPDLHAVAKRLEDKGVDFLIYLPCIKPSDTEGFSNIDGKQNECLRLLEVLPPYCGLIFDEGANIDAVQHEVVRGYIDKGICATEPCRFEYSDWSMQFDETFELISHYRRNPAGPQNKIIRSKGQHTLLEHHAKPEGWDRAAWLLDFTRECKALGYDWGVLAQPMHLNETGQIEMDHVDPDKNQ